MKASSKSRSRASQSAPKRSKMKTPQTTVEAMQAIVGPSKPSAKDSMTDHRKIPHVLWYTRLDGKKQGQNLGFALQLTIRREPLPKYNPGVPGRLFWTDKKNRVVVFGEGLDCDYDGKVLTFTSREKNEVEAFIHGYQSMQQITAARLGLGDVGSAGNWSISRSFMFSGSAPQGVGADLDNPDNDDLVFYDHHDHMHEYDKVGPSAKGKLISAIHRDADLGKTDPSILDDDDSERGDE